MKSKTYIKKPVAIEAIEWKGDNLFDVIWFIEGKKPDIEGNSAGDAWELYCRSVDTRGLTIRTLEGEHLATVGDMIIKGVAGEFYPCKPDIFKKTYCSEDEYAKTLD